jgi:DnaJ-domain-containing protein 1
VLPALLALTALFLFLFVGRVGMARRVELIRRWPALVLALAAFALALRGQFAVAAVCGLLGVIAWRVWPDVEQRFRKRSPATTDGPEDAAARALLGVSPTATAAEIRSAYRAKIARAHPDQGGTNADAARLTAARDRLLRKLR